jgi:hypothetical protein
VLHCAHEEYRQLAPGNTPGIVAVLDGRGTLDPVLWTSGGVAFAGIGRSAPGGALPRAEVPQ